MINVKTLPLRQKILIALTIIGGLFLMSGSAFNFMEREALNIMIVLYGVGVPLFLLMDDAVLDLDNKTIYGAWLVIATITFIVSLTTYNMHKFKFHRSERLQPGSGVNALLGEYSTSSLKTLLIFLMVYWVLNKLLNKSGLFLINTFRHSKWYHAGAQREITGIDVLANVILYAVILAAGLFGH